MLKDIFNGIAFVMCLIGEAVFLYLYAWAQTIDSLECLVGQLACLFFMVTIGIASEGK